MRAGCHFGWLRLLAWRSGRSVETLQDNKLIVCIAAGSTAIFQPVTRHPSYACTRPACLVGLFATAWLLASPAAVADQPEPDSQDLESDELADDDDFDLDDEFALLEDEAVIELAARHKQDIGMSPSAVSVITRQEIEASGATTIPDLLRLVPGMEVTIVSPFFTAIISRMQWTYENNAYLVLIDGREANFDLMGQPPWEVQPISLQDVERIEIIRGPGSALYGANAFAGVISITTRAIGDKTSASVEMLGGEVDLVSGGARVSTRAGDWGFALSAGADLANTHTDPFKRSKEVWKLRGLAEYRLGEKKRLLLEVGASRGYGPVPSGVGPIRGTFDTRVLRLAYESEDIRSQLVWVHTPIKGIIDVPLEFFGTRVASFVTSDVQMQAVDAQFQYTLPSFYEPLMIILGAAGRVGIASCDQFLDAESYLETRTPGIEYIEFRTGAFVHGEWAPVDWVTVTGGLRFDYNTETDHFLSPRLATVFRPAANHFVRLGAARAFRKPSFVETRVHPMVQVPDGSILSEGKLNELMVRVLGNSDLSNEELWSFELGYLGRYLDGELTLSLDLYYTLLRNMIELNPNMVEDDLLPGVPDLELSSALFEQNAPRLNIFGWELSARWSPIEQISLLASWSHKELVNMDLAKTADDYPKNLITLGGRFRIDQGLVGSLYLHTRSEFTDRSIDGPNGILGGYITQHNPNVMLILARLGYRIGFWQGLEAEAGLRLFLPVSPFEAPHFRIYERGGGATANGRAYGGDHLRRVVMFYLQGSY